MTTWPNRGFYDLPSELVRLIVFCIPDAKTLGNLLLVNKSISSSLSTLDYQLLIRKFLIFATIYIMILLKSFILHPPNTFVTVHIKK